METSRYLQKIKNINGEITNYVVYQHSEELTEK